MMNVIRVKPGVEFTTIAPAGFCILSALQQTVAGLSVDLEITSACDGVHSGPSDPHPLGEAYDVHSKDFTPEQKQVVLADIMATLGDRFYGFLESPGTDNEHFHIQRRKGTVYP